MSVGNLLISYILLRSVKKSKVGWTLVIYPWSMTLLVHLYNLIRGTKGLHFLAIQILMTQTMHLANIGWDYADADNLTKNESRTTLRNVPSLMEHLAAGLCPSQCLGGPISHVSDFLRYIYSLEEFKAEVNTQRESAKNVITGFIWLIVNVLITKSFPATLLNEPEFAQNDVVTRVF